MPSHVHRVTRACRMWVSFPCRLFLSEVVFSCFQQHTSRGLAFPYGTRRCIKCQLNTLPRRKPQYCPRSRLLALSRLTPAAPSQARKRPLSIKPYQRRRGGREGSLHFFWNCRYVECT